MQPPFYCDYRIEHRTRRESLLQFQLHRARRVPGADRRLHALRAGGADLYAAASVQRRATASRRVREADRDRVGCVGRRAERSFSTASASNPRTPSSGAGSAVKRGMYAVTGRNRPSGSIRSESPRTLGGSGGRRQHRVGGGFRLRLNPRSTGASRARDEVQDWYRLHCDHVGRGRPAAGGRRLDLDEDIQTYVREFPQKQRPVTLRQLMAHVAGVPDDGGRRGAAIHRALRAGRPTHTSS